MITENNTGRMDLIRWREEKAETSYVETHLTSVSDFYFGEKSSVLIFRDAPDFSSIMVRLGETIRQYENRYNLPRLESFDEFGNRIERVVFNPAYHEAGRAIYESGIASSAFFPGQSFRQAIILYLLSHEGEIGHACPIACTIGMARALRRKASPKIKDMFLPHLFGAGDDYDRTLKGAQFLTEVQGGSDVGANLTEAVLQDDGSYKLSGKKSFCSVAHAGLFLVSARVVGGLASPAGGPSGTKGIGCFLVPRLVEGKINGVTVQRLKDKFGTWALPTGEFEFNGAVAYPIGPVEEGFKTIVSDLLNTSRWLNSVSNVGMMHRAYLEALSYSKHRRAFGCLISEFLPVRETLARMKAEWLACLCSAWMLTALDNKADLKDATDEELLFYRFLVNANKYLVSKRCTKVVESAIEILGGNGLIEDFSVLPRLLRDSKVYELWEGTHNVLVAQILKDFKNPNMQKAIFGMFNELFKNIPDRRIVAVKDIIERQICHSILDESYGQGYFRLHLEFLLRLIQIGSMMSVALSEPESSSREIFAAGELLWLETEDPGYRTFNDPKYFDRINAILGRDLA